MCGMVEIRKPMLKGLMVKDIFVIPCISTLLFGSMYLYQRGTLKLFPAKSDKH